MASFTSHLFLHTGPAAYCSRKRLTYAMSSGPDFVRIKAIVHSLKNSKGKIALELPGKQLRFLVWGQVTRRCGSVQIPVTKAAAVEPSSACAEEERNLPILLYLDCFVLVAQLAVGITLCITNWSLGFHKCAPINKDLPTFIAPIAFFHTVVHLLFNDFLNSEVVRPVSLMHKSKTLSLTKWHILPFYATLGYWISRASATFGIWIFSKAKPHFLLKVWVLSTLIFIGAILSLTCRNIYSKQAMKSVDNTNVYAYASIAALFFCIPFALHKEGLTMQYQFSRAIAKKGMVTILYDFLLMGVLYYRCNKVATENLRRVDPVAFTIGIIFEYVCATFYSNY